MKRERHGVGVLVAMAILIAGCGSTEPDPAPVIAQTAAVPADLEVNTVDTNVDIDGVGYAVDGSGGRVEVIWNSETGEVSVDVPTELEGRPWALSTLSVEGIIGEAADLDSSMSTVIVPAGPVVGVSLSTDDFDFVVPFTEPAAAMYSSSWEPASVMPRSGYWTLEMLIGAEYLSGARCPSGGSTFATTGPAEIVTNDGGWSLTLIADNEYIPAQRQSLHSATYVSGERPFLVQTEEGQTHGVAVYELVAVSPDRIEGTLTWDNHDGCTARYPITIDLDAPYDVIYDIPEPGTWQLQIDLNSTCGTVESTTMTVDLGVTGGVGDAPALANAGWLSLIVGENGGLASLGSVLLPGLPALVETPPPVMLVPTSVLGTMHMTPVSAGSYVGTFIGSPVGSPACMVFGSVRFIRLG